MSALASLDRSDRDRIQALTKGVDRGRIPSLMEAMQLKLLLCERLPQQQAFEAYREATGANPQLRLRPMKICGLLDAVRDRGELLHVFHEQGPEQVCRPPRFDGPGSAPTIVGRPRTVFAGRLRDVIVHGRSPAICQGDRLIFDLQAGELDSVPVEMAFDPVVFSRSGADVVAIEDSDPAHEMRLERAWSLMGINSVSFGHWLIEQLPQFLAASSLPGFDGVPLLVDERMPVQHRQSLELFGAGRFRLVPVPRGTRVHVGELHVMSNWMYAPHLMKTDQGLDVGTFVPPVAAIAAVYAKAAAGFERWVPARPGGGVFWARGPERHRRIENLEALERLLAQRGYTRHLPETHSFADQIALLRGASGAVLQNGSGMHGFIFARPGTPVCLLSHPALPFIALFNELLLHLGHDLVVITGAFSRRSQTYLDMSDYSIPLDRVAGWLDRHAPDPGTRTTTEALP